jgi:hypothetical protein
MMTSKEILHTYDVHFVRVKTHSFCGIVARVLYRSRGPGSIPGANRFSEK